MLQSGPIGRNYMKNENIDLCGILNLLRQLIKDGTCSKQEAQKIAVRIAAQTGADLIFSL